MEYRQKFVDTVDLEEKHYIWYLFFKRGYSFNKIKEFFQDKYTFAQIRSIIFDRYKQDGKTD